MLKAKRALEVTNQSETGASMQPTTESSSSTILNEITSTYSTHEKKSKKGKKNKRHKSVSGIKSNFADLEVKLKWPCVKLNKVFSKEECCVKN